MNLFARKSKAFLERNQMKRSLFFARSFASMILVLAAMAAHCQLNTWVYKAHMLSSRSSFAAVTGADGRIYVFGGRPGTGPTAISAAEVYDPGTDSWSPIADLPEAMADEPAVLMPDGQIIIVSSSGSNNVYDYDPSTNSYSTLGKFDTSVMGIPRAGALVPNGKVYFDGFFSQDIGTYDFSTNAWTATKNLQNIFLDRAAFLSVGDTSYVIGGESGGPAVKSLDSYNWHTDVELSLADIPAARYELACTIGKDGRFYALGGVDAGTTNEADAYDPATNAWSTLASMQLDRGYFASVTGADGRIYAIGGYTGIGTNNATVTDTVESYQPALLTSTPATITATEGSPFSGTLALLKDLNTSQLASDFTVTIDWGDGTALDTGVVTGSGGNFKVTGGHTYTKVGPYTATLSITDGDGETATASDAVTVNDATVTLGLATITAQSGIAFSGLVGTLADANPLAQASDFTGTIDWGDGTTTTATIVAEQGGSKFDIDGTHTYAAVGVYSVHIKVLETGTTNQFLIHEPANVVAPTAVVSAIHFNAVEGANYTGPVATFLDADPNQTALNFTATIAWGDGTTSTGTVASNGSGGFTVTGSHTYAEEGSYTTSVTVAATGGLSSSSNGIGDVADAAITASGFDLICKGQNFSNTVAAFTDADLLGTTSDFSAAIFWGDGKSSNGTIVQAGSGWKVVGSHSYAKRGKYTATITIRDVGGSTASATTHINVGPVK
jgi:hypothetical protein